MKWTLNSIKSLFVFFSIETFRIFRIPGMLFDSLDINLRYYIFLETISVCKSTYSLITIVLYSHISFSLKQAIKLSAISSIGINYSSSLILILFCFFVLGAACHLWTNYAITFRNPSVSTATVLNITCS